MADEVASDKVWRAKGQLLWLAFGLAFLVLAGCATTQVVAPIAAPRQGSAAVEVEVLDRRPEPVDRDALEAALRQALERAAPRPGRLVIEVREYQARFIQGDVALMLLLGPFSGARPAVWQGVFHLWAIYRAEDGTELGRWSVKGEKAVPNTWGYRSGREALQAAFDEAVDRLVDQMALVAR